MKQICKIMQSVRDWCYDNRYNINPKGYDTDLCGMCAIASAKLFEALEQLGYKPTIAIAECEDDAAHCYIVCNDHVLDITSSQFGMEPIEIVHEKLACDLWFWNTKIILYSVDELIKYQKKTRWPKYQLVSHDIIRYNVTNIH